MLVSNNYLKLYTTNKQALQIIYLIKKFYNENLNNCTIVDATAGVGGNSIYFCKYCKFVYCIDTSLEAISYLEHNLKDYDNHCIINDNCTDILKIINYDIVFFDPPWGGSNYKYLTNIQLYLSGINIIKIIEYLYNYCQMIILKAPLNFRVNYDSKWTIHSNNIYKNDSKTITFKLLIFKKIKKK